MQGMGNLQRMGNGNRKRKMKMGTLAKKWKTVTGKRKWGTCKEWEMGSGNGTGNLQHNGKLGNVNGKRKWK